MDEIFYLDWDRDELLGWEYVSDRSIEAMINAIHRGVDFDPVVVNRVNSNMYRIAMVVLPSERKSGIVDGGHCRAVAHYIEGKPLKCRFQNSDDSLVLVRGWLPEEYFSIREMVLPDDEETKDMHGDVFGSTQFELRRRRFPEIYR